MSWYFIGWQECFSMIAKIIRSRWSVLCKGDFVHLDDIVETSFDRIWSITRALVQEENASADLSVDVIEVRLDFKIFAFIFVPCPRILFRQKKTQSILNVKLIISKLFEKMTNICWKNRTCIHLGAVLFVHQSEVIRTPNVIMLNLCSVKFGPFHKSKEKAKLSNVNRKKRPTYIRVSVREHTKRFKIQNKPITHTKLFKRFKFNIVPSLL